MTCNEQTEKPNGISQGQGSEIQSIYLQSEALLKKTTEVGEQIEQVVTDLAKTTQECVNQIEKIQAAAAEKTAQYLAEAEAYKKQHEPTPPPVSFLDKLVCHFSGHQYPRQIPRFGNLLKEGEELYCLRCGHRYTGDPFEDIRSEEGEA